MGWFALTAALYTARWLLRLRPNPINAATLRHSHCLNQAAFQSYGSPGVTVHETAMGKYEANCSLWRGQHNRLEEEYICSLCERLKANG